jgi:hypothetical protein
MKKSTIIAFVLGLFLISCGGNTAETGDAQEVTENNSIEAVEYASIAEGSHINWKATHLGGLAPRFGKVSIVKALVKTENNTTTSFELSGIEAGTGDYNSMVTGNLTIMDSTKSVKFNANITVSDSAVSIKSEDFTVNRLDWGLDFHKEGTEGVPTEYLISNELGFTIDATIKK